MILRSDHFMGPEQIKITVLIQLLKIFKKNELRYLGSKKASRRYIHVKDALACVQILNKKYENTCINITGKEITINKMFKKMSKIFGIKK